VSAAHAFFLFDEVGEINRYSLSHCTSQLELLQKHAVRASHGLIDAHRLVVIVRGIARESSNSDGIQRGPNALSGLPRIIGTAMRTGPRPSALAF
jgi:hypothetical protein